MGTKETSNWYEDLLTILSRIHECIVNIESRLDKLECKRTSCVKDSD